MTNNYGEQDRMSLDDEHSLDNLEREEDSIEAGPHNGFADATRVTKLRSEIEALKEHIDEEKQREE
jgi:hypothetical protein